MAEIEYYYSAHSAYAYLGAKEIYRICETHQVKLIHKPILLSPVVEAAGGLPFAGRSQAHVDYFFGRELERWAEWRELPIIRHRPTYHDNPLDLPNGLIIATQEAGEDVDALSFAILEAHWRDDADHADADTLAKLAARLGMDADALLTAAISDPIQDQHRANTEKAIELGLFGSPTYIVGEDGFYGQDRLEMVERALVRPFKAANWTNPSVDGT